MTNLPYDFGSATTPDHNFFKQLQEDLLFIDGGVSTIDQTLLDDTPSNSRIRLASAVTIEACTLSNKQNVTFIFPPGTVTVNGTMTFETCNYCGFEGGWTRFNWEGTTSVPMIKLSRSQFCFFRKMYMASSPGIQLGAAFWTMSSTSGQVSSHHVFEDIFVEGSAGLDYGWRIGVEGDANGNNDDFHQYVRCLVSEHDIAAWSIEQPEAKYQTFRNCIFVGNGQYGVTTGLNGGQGGSFLFFDGGGGGMSEADFFLGATDDLIVIQGCQLESSNRVLDMTSAFASSWPVHIRDCRIATDAINADNKVIIYKDRGPLMLTNCLIEAFSKAVEINLAATGRCQGIAIGCSINSTLANPFTTTNAANGQWLVYGTNKGVDGENFVPWPMVIPVLTFAELPADMMSGGLVHITDSPVATAGTEITVGGGGNDVLAWCNDGSWFVVGFTT